MSSPDTMNENAVGFCWFTGNSCICVTIWFNPDGYTGLIDANGEPVYGAMQASINTVPGVSQEEDINQTCNWGSTFPLHIAVQLVDECGGWIKEDKLGWRPRAKTNSPLKLKLAYKSKHDES